MLNIKRGSFNWAATQTAAIFFMFRLVEFASLLGLAILIEMIRLESGGIANASPVVVLLAATLGFYIGFGYIVISAIVFFLAWCLAKRMFVSLPLVNAVPLIIWGIFALLVIYGLRMPGGLLVALVGATAINVILGRIVQPVKCVKA